MHAVLLLTAALCGAAEGPAPPARLEEAELSRLRQGLVAWVVDRPANLAAEAPPELHGTPPVPSPASGSAAGRSDAEPTAPRRPGELTPSERLERGAELLVIARAVRAVSSQLDTVRVRERGDWLAALSLARNLRHLGYPHRALDRYRLALEADPHAAFTSDAVAELAEVVIALGDSAVLSDQLRWIIARPDAATHTASLGRLLVARLAWAPGADSAEFADRVQSLAAEPSPAALVAVGRERQAAGRFQEALAAFRGVLAEPAVAPQELACAARGMGDCFFALGRHLDARAVYGELQRREIGDFSVWATYQIGTIESLQGNHVAAAGAFRAVCEQQRTTRWQQDACWQLRIAEQLLEISAPAQAGEAPHSGATAMGGGS